MKTDDEAASKARITNKLGSLNLMGFGAAVGGGLRWGTKHFRLWHIQGKVIRSFKGGF